jgi:hypothetical protein
VIVILATGGGEPANSAIKCTVSNSTGTVAMTIKGRVTKKEAEDGCTELAARLSGGGSYWRVGLPLSEPGTPPEIMCGLNAPEGEGGPATVEYNPEASSAEATTICGNLAHKGWTTFTHGGVEGPWQFEYQQQQELTEESEAFEVGLAEEQELEAEAQREAEDAEVEEVDRAYYACETDAEARLRSEREAIQTEYKPLETGDAEHIYEVQQEAEELELDAEGREFKEIGKCQRRVEEAAGEAATESGLVAPEFQRIR